MPSRIDASPEEIVRAFFRLPVDHEWQYDKTPQCTTNGVAVISEAARLVEW